MSAPEDSAPALRSAGDGDEDRAREADVDVDLPPEALAPSGRSEDSLPDTAPNPSTGSEATDPDDGSTELPPVSPDA